MIRGHFTDERLRLFASLASHASVAMQKSLIYQDQKETAEIAQALLDFGSQVAGAEGMDQVLDISVELVARQLGAPSASIWTQDKAGGLLTAKSMWGLRDDQMEIMERAGFAGPIIDGYLRRSSPFVLHPKDIESMGADPNAVSSSLAVAPMRLEGGRFAALAVSAPALGDYEFSERKMRLLAGIANQLQLASEQRIRFRQPRANVPGHRRGARKCARSEGRIHLGSCPVDHRRGPLRRRGTRA